MSLDKILKKKKLEHDLEGNIQSGLRGFLFYFIYIYI